MGFHLGDEQRDTARHDDNALSRKIAAQTADGIQSERLAGREDAQFSREVKMSDVTTPRRLNSWETAMLRILVAASFPGSERRVRPEVVYGSGTSKSHSRIDFKTPAASPVLVQGSICHSEC